MSKDICYACIHAGLFVKKRAAEKSIYLFALI